MKRAYILLSCILLAATACKKEAQKPASSWSVNGQEFSTADVRTEKGKARQELITHNHTNGFQLMFNLDAFPLAGKFLLDCSSNSPSFACLSILHKDTSYLPNASASILAELHNGRPRYILEKTWFYNSYGTNDSISVQGVFSAP